MLEQTSANLLDCCNFDCFSIWQRMELDRVNLSAHCSLWPIRSGTTAAQLWLDKRCHRYAAVEHSIALQKQTSRKMALDYKYPAECSIILQHNKVKAKHITISKCVFKRLQKHTQLRGLLSLGSPHKLSTSKCLL